MDLFEFSSQQKHDAPLAEAMRPRQWEDLLGQQDAVGAILKNMSESGRLPSLVIWGPPGCGKTTFARLLAKQSSMTFIDLNAVDAGVKVLKQEGELGRRRWIEQNQRTILFVDEIHRLNRTQQDTLLPFVERGDVVLVGATTENPGYQLNSALLSRCRLVVFNRLSESELKHLLERALGQEGKKTEQFLTPNAEKKIFAMADGDGRRLLNFAEQILWMRNSKEISWPVDIEGLSFVLGQESFAHDRAGDHHYDTISALIKSIRGSDPDASLYYLARLIKGSEDPLFIARRLVILASEDIGNADPKALSVAVSGFKALELIGMPEGRITLAQMVTYLATAPKSNRSYQGLAKATKEVDLSGHLSIPLHLRSGQVASLRELGHGRDYKYSHDGPKGWVAQDFLPQPLIGKRFYEPTQRGYEKSICEYLKWIKEP